MSKPKGAPTKQICIRVPLDLFNAIEEYATDTGLSVTEMARRFLEYSVRTIKEEEQQQEEEYD